MTWAEARVALQLEAEERVGTLMRQRARERKAMEDAAVSAMRQAIG